MLRFFIFILLTTQSLFAQSFLDRLRTFTQDPRTYYKFSLGTTIYGGDTDLNPTGSIKKYWDDKGWIFYGEIGKRFSKRFEAGASAQVANYPQIEPGEYPNQVANNFKPNQTVRPMLHAWGRYNINLDAKILTHFQVGIPLLFGHYYNPKPDANGTYGYKKSITIGSGIGFGFGLSYPIHPKWAIFSETHQDLIFPDDAADSADYGRDLNAINPENPYSGDFNNYDWLSSYMVGIRYNKGSLKECTIAQIENITGTETIAMGQAARFTAQTTNGNTPIEYFWDFGDGETAIGKTTEHTFKEAGTYMVKFSTLNCNQLQTQTVEVTVLPIKQESGCNLPSIRKLRVLADNRNPKLLSFNAEIDGGTAPLTYHWDFGDGESSLLISPEHNYSQAGTYTTTFKVENCGGTLSQSQIITIYDQYQPQQECVGLDMPFLYFEQNQARLTESSRNALIAVIPKLRKCITVEMQIVGYASQYEANKADLSLSRAEAIRSYLARNGIATDRMRTQGYGEAPNACVTAFECNRNRRAAIFLNR